MIDIRSGVHFHGRCRNPQFSRLGRVGRAGISFVHVGGYWGELACRHKIRGIDIRDVGGNVLFVKDILHHHIVCLWGYLRLDFTGRNLG